MKLERELKKYYRREIDNQPVPIDLKMILNTREKSPAEQGRGILSPALAFHLALSILICISLFSTRYTMPLQEQIMAIYQDKEVREDFQNELNRFNEYFNEVIKHL